MRSVSRVFTVVLALLLVLSVLPGIVAADSRAAPTVVIEAGETVTEDLEVFAAEVIVRGTVEGDLSVFGGDVTIAEGGRVTGDVNAISGAITVAGAVEGDVSMFAGELTLAETGRIAGDLSAVTVDTVVAGVIDGNVQVGAETLTLTETARIGGEFRYDAETFTNDGTVGEGAVGGADPSGESGPDFDVRVGPVVPPAIPDALFGVYAIVVNFVLGALLLAVSPAFAARTTQYARTKPIEAGGMGLLALVGIPIVLVLLLVTVVGIPLSIIGLFVFVLLALVGSAVGRIAVGEWLTHLVGRENRWLSLVVGLLAVAVLVRIPVVGIAFDLVVFLLGLGALAATLYRGRPDEPAADGDTGSPGEGVRPA